MLWGSFSASGTEDVLEVEGIIKMIFDIWRMIWEDFERKLHAFNSKPGSGSSLCLPK